MKLFVRLIPLAAFFLSASAWAGEIVVSAAASLNDAMKEAVTAFEKQNPEIRVVLNLGGSGALAQQIRHGAPADVYVSAATEFMTSLVDDGMIRPDSVRDLWGNELVLVGRANFHSENGWEVLRDPSVRRIALGETRSVPAGRYGLEVLEHFGMWEDVQDKVVLTKDVRQALTYVASNAVDAAIVYRTDLQTVEGLTVLAVAPPGSHAPIRYPVGITTRSKNADEAKTFILFLASAEGSAHFVRHGFVRLDEAP